MSLVYRNENTLFRLAWLFSALVWFGLTVGTVGVFLLYLLGMLVGYLFIQSGFISYVRGSGVRLSPGQLPELHERLIRCCEKLDVDTMPDAYVLNAHGILNALATRFLRRHYVILFSDVLDALKDRPEALNFYIGHELGHIKRGHLRWAWFLWPAMILPVIGPAYSRAREYSCDLHGLACCENPLDAAYGLAVLASGPHALAHLDLYGFAQQSEETGSFWMSFHELTGTYPWLTKRLKHIMAVGGGAEPDFPRRHAMAWLISFMVPPIGTGGGAAASMMAMVAIIGILAAIAVPNFLRFQARSNLVGVSEVRNQVEQHAGAFILESEGYMPNSLSAMGLPEDLSNDVVAGVEVMEQAFVIHLHPELRIIGGGRVAISPYFDDDGVLQWSCEANLPDETLIEQACSGGPAAGGFDPVENTSLAPNEVTCSPAFRDGADWAAMSEAERDELRHNCNLWKLQQAAARDD